MRRTTRTAALLLALAIGAGGAGAQEFVAVTPPPIECILGSATAEVANHDLGIYRYSIHVDWNTGTQHGVSHIDLILGLGGCDCVCNLFSFGSPDTAGTSTGTADKGGRIVPLVCYEGFFECGGDPSIPGDEGPLVKWEPLDGEYEPGNTGSGDFVFYSDWPPAPVDSGNCYLLIKFAGQNCCGELTGELPSCTCPSSVENQSWGGVKRLFR